MSEQALLCFGQQLVAPVQRCPQRLMTRQRGSAAAGKQRETIVEMLRDLLDPKRCRPSRSELDSERDTVELPADRQRSPEACLPPAGNRSAANASSRQTAAPRCDRRRSSDASTCCRRHLQRRRRDRQIRRRCASSLPARGKHRHVAGKGGSRISAIVAAASTTCSQLSRTSSTFLSADRSSDQLRRVVIALQLQIEREATVDGTRSGSDSETSSTNKTSLSSLSGKACGQLPTPARSCRYRQAPVNVTTR